MVTPFVVKNAATAAASAAKGAAKIAVTEKAAKAFEGATSNINKAYDKGAMQSFEAATNNIMNMGAVLVPLQVITAQLTAGTSEASITLMKELLDAIQSETGQAAIEILSTGISKIMGYASEFINLIGNSEGILKFFNGLMNLALVLSNIQLSVVHDAILLVIHFLEAFFQAAGGATSGHPELEGVDLGVYGQGPTPIDTSWWAAMGYASEAEALAALGGF